MITQDNINFLFGPFGSGAAKAASTISEKYKVPTIAATASSSQVYDQGYKYLFGTFTPNDTLTTPLTQIIKAKGPDVKKVAILARNDLFPLAIAQEMEKSAKANGMEVVYFEKYAIGTLDHSATLSQIKSLAPQWIFITGYINDLILIRKQMVDQQMKAAVVTMIAGPAYQEFIDAAGQSAENVTSASWWHPAEQYDGKDIFGSTANFVKLFKAKYNERARLRAGIGRSCAARCSRWRSRTPAPWTATRCATNWPSSTSSRSSGRSSSAPTARSIRLSRRYSRSREQSPWCCSRKRSSRANSSSGSTEQDCRGHKRVLNVLVAQVLINALVLGCLYACIAIGFSLVWGVLNVINLIHGSFIVLGAYLAFGAVSVAAKSRHGTC